MFRLLYTLATIAMLAGCCAQMPQSAQLASRIKHASTHESCPPNATVSTDCLDDQGLVWSACAWNTCGLSKPCRETHQQVVAAGSCGGPDWPDCKATRQQGRRLE